MRSCERDHVWVSLQSHEAAVEHCLFRMYWRCACPNCTTYNTALPLLLSNKPAEWEVDRTSGSGDVWGTDRQTDRDSRRSAAGWTCSSLPALWTWWTCPRPVGAPLSGLFPFVSSCSQSPGDDRSASSAGTEEPIRTKYRNTHGCWTFGPNYLFRFCSRCILDIKRESPERHKSLKLPSQRNICSLYDADSIVPTTWWRGTRPSSHPDVLQLCAVEVLQGVDEGVFDVDIQSVSGLSDLLQRLTYSGQSAAWSTRRPTRTDRRRKNTKSSKSQN